jgi:uncharacterized protein (TIGR02300 family)
LLGSWLGSWADARDGVSEGLEAVTGKGSPLKNEGVRAAFGRRRSLAYRGSGRQSSIEYADWGILLLTGRDLHGIGQRNNVKKKRHPWGVSGTTPDSGRQPVAKPEWGRKVTCTGCGNKFYDMKREPAICPSCGAENDPLQAFRPKRSAAPKPAPQTAAKPKEAEAADEDEDDLDAVLPDVDDDDIDDDDVDDSMDDDDDDDDLMEDTADLGEDDDDLDEVREHMESEEDVKE